MSRVVTRMLPLLACALVAAACARDDAPPAGDAAAGASATQPSRGSDGFPALYVDRVLENLTDGRNVQRDGYRQRLADCMAAGLPTRALEPSEEELVGTERWQVWRGQDRVALRTEAFMVATPGEVPTRETMCRFELQRGGTHAYVDAGRSVSIDLGTGERFEDYGDPGIRLERTGADGSGMAGGGEGMQGPRRTNVLGQPCDEWTSADGATACVWAGGTEWGFDSGMSGPFFLTDGISDSFIVLSAEPPQQGSGTRVVTRSIEVGGALDPGALLPAPGGN